MRKSELGNVLVKMFSAREDFGKVATLRSCWKYAPVCPTATGLCRHSYLKVPNLRDQCYLAVFRMNQKYMV